ncbi:MAG: carboxypeptidase-like regulatory domain-containing protein [Planctomycetota bacterium]
MVDQNQQPLQGYRVQMANRVGQLSRGWAGHQSNSQFVTDAEGKFALRNIPEGDSYKVNLFPPRVPGQRFGRLRPMFSVSTKGPQTLQYNITPDSMQPQHLRFTRVESLGTFAAEQSPKRTANQRVSTFPIGTKIRGTIRLPNGQPAENALVKFYRGRFKGSRGNEPGNGRAREYVYSDSDGSFSLPAIAGLTAAELTIEYPGCAIAKSDWLASDKPMTVQLSSPAAITGTLTLDAVPVPVVELIHVEYDENRVFPPASHRCTTGVDGSFQFEGLRPGGTALIYSRLGQDAFSVLPSSQLIIPAAGKRGILENLRGQTPSRLTIIVKTNDGSPLPQGSTFRLLQGRQISHSQSTLPDLPESKVVLRDAPNQVIEAQFRLRGWEIIKTDPLINESRNRSWSIFVQDDTTQTFVLRRIQ